MAQIFYVILSLSVSGGLVGLLILLIRPVTRRFFAKKWTYYLWLLVLVRLMVPVHVDVNVMEHLSAKFSEVWNRQVRENERADNVNPDETAQERYVEAVLDPAGAENTEEMLREAGSENEAVIIHEADTENTDAMLHMANGGSVGMTFDETDSTTRIFFIAGIFWLLGVLLSAVWRLYIYRRFVRAIYAGCMPVTDGRVLEKSAEIQSRLGIGQRVPLYESTAVGSPILIGFRKPRIILSSELLGEMTGRENDICLILHHELVHYKRRDIWYKWLFQTILCIHWFNPLLYLFNRKFNMDCELACDEMVMSLLTEEGRKAYGGVLLDVAETSLSGNSFAVHKKVPAMTLLEEKHTLKERLHGITRYHKEGFVVGLCSAGVLAVLVTVAVICGVTGVRSGSWDIDRLPEIAEVKSSGFMDHIWENMTDNTFDEIMNGPMVVNYNEDPYQMYDEDALIAGDSNHDVWHADNYRGGGQSVEVQGFLLNGSDILWIMYADKDTALEITSSFTLGNGRFKIVHVLPDKTVRVLNESGVKTSEEVFLPAGRNCFKIVGQKARLKNLNAAYSSVRKKDIGGIYRSEDEEYAYLVQSGAEPFDLSRLEEVCIYLDEGYLSGLCRTAWDTGVVLSEENWQDLFTYSDVELTSGYLLEALQAGKVKEFDSGILNWIAYTMDGKDVSECFRCLLERGKVSESDWENIFIYSDSELSAKYLLEALQNGNGNGFNGKVLDQIGFLISPEILTDIVLALDKDELTFDSLSDHVMPYLDEEQNVECILHYINLGNVLTDSQLRELEGYVSEKSFYRIVEQNGKNKLKKKE